MNNFILFIFDAYLKTNDLHDCYHDEKLDKYQLFYALSYSLILCLFFFSIENDSTKKNIRYSRKKKHTKKSIDDE